MKSIEVETVHCLPAGEGKPGIFWHAGEERVTDSYCLSGGTHFRKRGSVRDQARALESHPFSGVGGGFPGEPLQLLPPFVDGPGGFLT